MKTLLSALLFFGLSQCISAQKIFPLQSTHSSTKEVVDIMVTDINGESIPLSSIMTDDKNYVVSIMASWCGPCRIELDVFQMVADRWKKELNTEVIALSVDKPTDSSKLFDLVRKQKWTMQILHEKMAYTSRELEVYGIPQTFLVNKKGEITYQTKGYKSNLVSKYEKEIMKLD